jgi:hypothetical protein
MGQTPRIFHASNARQKASCSDVFRQREVVDAEETCDVLEG